jgi:uncharacterized protein
MLVLQQYLQQSRIKRIAHMKICRSRILAGVLLLTSLDLCVGCEASAQQGKAAQGSFKVRMEFNIRMPMRDGVTLATDIYRPDAPGRFPVILTRTPYGRSTKQSGAFGLLFAKHGFVYVVQDTRGRYDSDGGFHPRFHEVADGDDSIEWVARQAWSSGSVGTFGASYSAWNQWQQAPTAGDHLKAMISIVTLPDPFLNVPYQNGAFLTSWIEWMLMMSTRTNQDLSMYDLPTLYRHLPLSTIDQAAGRNVPWWKDFTAHNSFDSYWKPIAYMDKYASIKVPVLHVDGWFDDDLIGSLTNFPGMEAHGGTPEARRGQRLIIGPWVHHVNTDQKLADTDFGPQSLIDLNSVYLQWFDCYLKNIGCKELAAEPPVKVFEMGANRWREEKDWPLPQAKVEPFYFSGKGRANTVHGDGVLTRTVPKDEAPDHFTYDPENPVPTIYLPGASPFGTTEDQRPVESRPDVLVYTSVPLDEPVQVTGPIKVKLWAASSAPDTDWTAKLIDVHPDGYAQRLIENVLRARYRESFEKPSLLQPGKTYEYEINLWATSNLFKKGHRIRVEISSSNFPRYSRNLNTGKSNETTTEMQVAKQTIYHDSAHPSSILLPIVPTER